MKPETLEALLIDHALGRHSPDVEALLAEYLAADPAAARTAAELRDLVALATAALRRPVARLELPLHIEGLFWFRRANRVLALAASFIVGVGVALLAIRSAGPRLEAPSMARRSESAASFGNVKAPPTPPEIARTAKALPFWSQRRAYLLASTSKDSTRTENTR
jgi:hypothetical protein